MIPISNPPSPGPFVTQAHVCIHLNTTSITEPFLAWSLGTVGTVSGKWKEIRQQLLLFILVTILDPHDDNKQGVKQTF